MRCTLFKKRLNNTKRFIPIPPKERKLPGLKDESQTSDRPGTVWMIQPPNYGRVAQL